MYRQTYVKVNLKNIYDNVKTVINNYSYKYYIGVVKANCYGHGLDSIKQMIKAGCNYLAVATLEEAIEVRELYPNIPILCLGVIRSDFLHICVDKNITITINTMDYYNEIKDLNLILKVHIKLNTGMNRLGINNKNELNNLYNSLKSTTYFVEGIYSHIYDADNKINTNKQFDKFYELCSDINLNDIEMVHIAASDTLTKYPKNNLINGIRLGIIMYGFSKELELKSTFSLHSSIIQINNIDNTDKVGYNGAYIPNGKEKIGVVGIGYADGIIREYKDSYIYINNREYKIVGNVCMDMLFVKIDNLVNVHDKVTLLKDNVHIMQISNHLNTIPYEILCSISNRVPRIYDDN